MHERIHQLQEKYQPDEDWLQRYIGKHPEVLPMRDLEGIDLGFRLIARELKDMDLLFADERGLLTIVETKLIQNPEARRQVVAQILDYASRLGKMDVLALCKELSVQKNKEETVRDFPEIRDLSKLLFDCLQSESTDSATRAKRIFCTLRPHWKVELRSSMVGDKTKQRKRISRKTRSNVEGRKF